MRPESKSISLSTRASTSRWQSERPSLYKIFSISSGRNEPTALLSKNSNACNNPVLTFCGGTSSSEVVVLSPSTGSEGYKKKKNI